jgi:hypothetical protein
LERMRNGTYVANYQTIVIPPVIPTGKLDTHFL